MKRRDAFELYTDYLIASPGKATATGLSAVLNDELKHDYISDFLSQDDLDKKAFWQEIKPFVRQIEGSSAYISIDDVIVDKPHSTENEIICYHFDHTKGKTVKGINIVNFLLSNEVGDELLNCPLSYEIIAKTETYVDKKSGKIKRKSPKTKNEIVLEQLHQLTFRNQVKYKYVLFDSWFSASDTLAYIHKKLKKVFICPLKTNRLVALSKEDKLAGKFIHLSEVSLENRQCLTVWLKGLDFPVKLTRQVFINKDRSTAELWLVTNDLSMDYDQITTIYQKRWKVEEMHKSLKQNTLLGRSPTKMEISQANHIFASMIAYVKLEKLRVKERSNHFALKAKLYIKMVQAAWEELRRIKARQLANN